MVVKSHKSFVTKSEHIIQFSHPFTSTGGKIDNKEINNSKGPYLFRISG